MIKRALVAAAGIFGLCSAVSAQQNGHGVFSLAQSPDFFAGHDNLLRAFPVNTFLTPSSFNHTLGWMDPVAGDFPLLGGAGESQKVAVAASSGRGLANRLTDLLPGATYATGEVGFLYGRSSGKFGGDYKQGYIIGEVGDDRIHISVGASYEDSNLRPVRFAR